MTSPISSELVEAVTEEFDATEDVWADSLNLGNLLGAAQHFGALPGLELQQLLVLDQENDEFLLTLQVSPRIVLCSELIRWDRVRPPAGVAGPQAVEHVLRRLGELAFVLRFDFEQDAVLRPVGAGKDQPAAIAE
ncbi:hypothetical protein [Peterkaempfera bronchialis]|uniref:Uncharacterized protein n=1 Tax=Peterkaempfera bronchialis TaxID=2126346 RepID=A0A345SX90_9ACTN|nr:hypothetical protein [Peterkaempfera bronchialis]AXI78345.1 hypothetical protein C7M71_013775 [Peterkaempfera bronchialis]